MIVGKHFNSELYRQLERATASQPVEESGVDEELERDRAEARMRYARECRVNLFDEIRGRR